MIKLVLFIVPLAASIVAHAQPAAISIIAPTTGANLISGTTTSLTIKISNPASLTKIIVAGSAPFSDYQLLPSAETVMVPVRIPSDTPLGRYGIQVLGLTATGIVASTPIVVFVNSAAPIGNISLRPRTLLFRFVGDSSTLTASGVISNVRRSLGEGQLRYVSSNLSVASVTNDGLVIAQGVGQATITAFSTLGVQAVENTSVSVVKSMKGDLNGNGIVDVYDVAALEGHLGQTPLGPNDQRDLNNDGKIDALDLRILVNLCTYPRCASTKP